jgi:hypothetical protein
VFVIPWDQVEGFLNGDDGDSVVGFFNAVESHDLTRDRSEPAFISRERFLSGGPHGGAAELGGVAPGALCM